MEEILLFILFALTTASFMYMLVCTDSNSKSPMGIIRRKLYTNGPSILKYILNNQLENYWETKYILRCNNFITMFFTQIIV